MASLSDVRALKISDENASDDDRLVTAARADTSATMANTTVDRTIPSQGVLFDSGASVKYTVDTADNITVFYA